MGFPRIMQWDPYLRGSNFMRNLPCTSALFGLVSYNDPLFSGVEMFTKAKQGFLGGDFFNSLPLPRHLVRKVANSTSATWANLSDNEEFWTWTFLFLVSKKRWGCRGKFLYMYV